MSPEFWAAYNTYALVFGLGVLFGIVAEKIARKVYS